MKSFLHTVLDSLIAKGWSGLRNYTLVFPMQRASLYAKQYLREQMEASGLEQPVVLPRMLTIDQLVDDLSDLSLVDEIRSVCLLYTIYKECAQPQLPLDAFYGWGRQLVNDFSNIDMSLSDVRNLVSNMAASQSLEQLPLDDEQREALLRLVNIERRDESVEQFFRQLWASLPLLYDRFSAALRENHLGTKGACYRWVIEHFDEILPRLENRTFVFVGFNYLLPAEHRLMALLHARRQALFYWDYDPSFRLDNNVYQFIRGHIEQFGNELEVKPLSILNSQFSIKPVTAISTVSANAQDQYVNQWLTATHHEGQRTAVVITDEKMLEAVLQALPASCSGHVNITKGYPLANTATYSEVVNYLQADQKHDRMPGETDYSGVLTRLSADLKRPEQVENATTANWYQLVQVEAYCQTQLLINRFIALIQEGVLRDVSELRTLRNLLRRCMDLITLPFHGEPIEEIQIIGVLETRLLDFDNLLILNVEEGVVPGSSRDNSFLPFDLRKEHNMPTYEEDSIVYAYNFFRLIRRAGQVTLLFSEATGDTSKKTMSRFLMQMILSPDYAVNKYRLVESSATPQLAAVQPSMRWIDTAAKRTYLPSPDGQEVSGLTLSLSPSALGCYIECPRQFYLSNILHVDQPDETSLIMERNDLGSLFHGAIQTAYDAITGKTPGPTITPTAIYDYLSADKWEHNAEEALDEGYRSLIANYNRHHRQDPCGDTIYIKADHPSENAVVREMLRNALLSDARRLGAFCLCLQEADRRRCILVPGCDLPILMGGTIDRLDIITEDDEQYLRILDYKTGSHKPSKVSSPDLDTLFTDHEKQYLLQTLIYSSVCYEYRSSLNPSNLPIMPQLMYTQKLSADRHVTINKVPITDYANHVYAPSVLLRERFEQLLRAKISDILADTTFEQCDEAICGKSFCPYHALCGRQKNSDW